MVEDIATDVSGSALIATTDIGIFLYQKCAILGCEACSGTFACGQCLSGYDLDPFNWCIPQVPIVNTSNITETPVFTSNISNNSVPT